VFEQNSLLNRMYNIEERTLDQLGQSGEKNSFTSFRRLMVLDWIPTSLHIGERASTVLISGASPIKESNQ